MEKEKKKEGEVKIGESYNSSSIGGGNLSKENKNLKNKQLNAIFIIFGILLVISFMFFYIISSVRSFEVDGVKFNVVKEGNLIFYNTAIPLYRGAPVTGNFIGDYNFYLRKDPRKISKNVPFEGKLFLLENIAVNSKKDFNCDGDGIIAVANLAKLLEKMGANVIKDENASCDDAKKKYVYIDIKEGDETKVRQSGITCYELYVNNCEILEVTERFMLEAFKEIDKA